MYKCPNCGGEMEFLPESGKIKCEYCGSVFSPEDEDISKTRKSAQEYEDKETSEQQPENEWAGKVYICSQCGAALYTTEETGVTFCSYCGSQAFLESRIKGLEGIEPDLLIPFQISKEQCGTIYKNKIKSAWFLPKEMKDDTEIDKFRGIYMPCWVYGGEAKVDGDYRSVVTTRSGSYDIIDTYDVKVKGTGKYAGYVRDASSSFPDGIMKELSPFDMNRAVKFNDKYITGFYADIGNVPPEIYEDEVMADLESHVKTDISSTRKVRNYGVTSTDVNERTDIDININDVRKGFFPVWFLSNRNKHNGMMSYAVVNALTGKIHVDLPVDFKKYLLVSLLIAIPAFLILQFFTLRPGPLLIITLLILGVMAFVSTRMYRETYIQEHGLDDEGLQYLDDKKGKKIKREEKYKVKKPGKGKRTLFGFICFVGIPLLSAILTYILDVHLIFFGFVVGIIAFIAIVSTGSNKKENFKTEKRIKLPFIIVIRSMLFPLIGIVTGLIITIAEPANDLYYYIAVLIGCFALIMSMLDFVRSTSRLSMRKPAQLGKRGGDEND